MRKPEKITDVSKYVFIELPRCPKCGAVEYRRQRTARDGEIKIHICRCEVCGWHFKIIYE